jgi:hypothetical protein
MSGLTVIEGGSDEQVDMADITASKSWSNRARNRAKILAEQVEMGYLELGELLYRIYDAPVDGDPLKGSLLSKWGYNNIGEFSEKELNIHYKKAQRLIRIFYRVHVEMGGFDNPELLTRFRKVGWSKARELIRVMTKETAEFWITKAEQVNFTTIAEIVRQTLERAEQAKIKAAVAKQDPIGDSNRTSEDGLLTDYSDVSNPDFVDQTWVMRTFRVDAGAAETIDLALKRAKDLSNNPNVKNGSLLSLICLQFLSYADWRGNDEISKLKFLANIEKALGGLSLVVVNDSNDVVYGLGALERAAMRMRDSAETTDAPPVEEELVKEDEHDF